MSRLIRKYPWSAAIAAFALLCLVLIPTAYALTGAKNLDWDYRVKDGFYLRYNSDVAPANGCRNGAIASTTIQALTSFTITAGSICQPLYPAVMRADFTDNVGTNDALECDFVTFRGVDQFGVQKVETVVVPDENPVYVGSTVFARVDQISGTGCTAGTDAADLIILYTSDRVGVRAKLRDYTKVEALCIRDETDQSFRCKPPNNGTANDIESAYNTANYYIDADSGTYDGQSAADSDYIYIRTRP